MPMPPPPPPPPSAPSAPISGATRAAIDQGVPLFLDGDIARSSPGSASPYLIDEANFYRIFAVGDARRALADRLRAALETLETHCRFQAMLVGGSMLDLNVQAPRDLDAVVFYAAQDGVASPTIAEALSRLTEASKAHGLDLRFVPTDASPLITIKAACYFAMLYASDRADVAARKGALLITRGR